MVRKIEWYPPQEIAEIVNEFKADIGCGVICCELLPKPNCPSELRPQE